MLHFDMNHLIDDQSLSPSKHLYQPVRRGRGRPKLRSDDEQRADVIAAANTLFLENGYFATRMDDIALHRGMSKRTLYRLFPSKLDLFRAIVIRLREAMLDFDALGREASFEKGLRATFRIGVDPHVDMERQRLFAQVARDGKDLPELIEIMKRECLKEVRMQLAAKLSRLNHMGRPSLKNPAIAASMLVDMIIGPLFLDRTQEVKQDVQSVETCIHYFVNGIS